MHGITEQQWLAFSEGRAGDADRLRIETHVAECAECRSISGQMTSWHAALAEEGGRLRASLAQPDASIERMLTESMARISASGRPAPGNAVEALVALRGLLSPVFGAGTVWATIDAALRITAPGGISAATWPAFASQWSEAIQSICGQAAGRLARGVALALPVNEARTV